MKEIRLYGEAAQKFGKVHHFAVKSAAEAIRALKANCKGFEKYMCEAHTHGVGFKMFVGSSKINDYPEIHNPAGRAQVIRLVPVIKGSKSGFFQILEGIILITAAIVLAPLTAGGSLSFLPGALGTLGVSLILSGLAQVLAQPPEKKEDKTSWIFSGPQNTDLQGKAIPVGYGRLIVGSAIISAGIETYDT